ncbi:MAG: GGDEF domain-containing response regulator [Phycisphaerae bacterium]
MSLTSSDKPRVLVVDDDRLTVTLVTRLVTASGFEADGVMSGQEALRALLSGEYQIVLTDWMMGELSGLDLTSAIREVESLPFTYVILMTASEPTPERIEEAFNAGVDDFIGKPLKRAALIPRLHAGHRVIRLQEEVSRRQREIHRFNAEMQVANNKLVTAQEQLRQQAITDSLTGLPNRRAAMDQLKTMWSGAVRRDQSLCAAMIDIDHFKNFNDTYGHDVGDKVLKIVAHTLTKAARDCDPVFRLGGEEFLVLCPQANESQAVVAAERLRQAIEESKLDVNGESLTITASIGVAERTPDMARQDDLIKIADEALYAAKRNGRNRVYSSREQTELVAESA